MAAEPSSEDEFISLAIGMSNDCQFADIEIDEQLMDDYSRGEYLYSVQDIEEVLAASGEPEPSPSSDYYVMELIDDSSSYRPLFDVEAVDVSEYQLTPPGHSGENLMSEELLSRRQQLLDDHFPPRAWRYGYVPDSSSSSSSSINASIYFRYSSDMGLMFSGSSSSCYSAVSIVLLVVLVVCIVVFLPFGDPRREWVRCDRVLATDDVHVHEKSKQKTDVPMSLADAIFILRCAADQLQSMHCSWFDASTDSNISLTTLRLLVTTLERELSLGVSLGPQRSQKRTWRSEFIVSKLDVLLTKLNRDKDAMNRLLALHTISGEEMHVDDRKELFLRTSELSCVVGELAAVQQKIVTQGMSECRHLLGVVDRLKTAVSARDVGLLVDVIEYAAMYCQEEHTDEDESPDGEGDLYEQEAGPTMRTLRSHHSAASVLLDELYDAEQEQVRKRALLQSDQLWDMLSGGLSLSLSLEEGSTTATEIALPSNADLQMPGNSVVASLWTIEFIRAGKELADRTEHELRQLDEQRLQRRVSARNNARKLRADRDREIRSAQLSLVAISEQKKTRAAVEEESLRKGTAALDEEYRRLSRAQKLADYRLFCVLAVLLPVVYLGCLLRAGLETDHLWDRNMRTHPLEFGWSFSMSFLSRLCDHLACADSSDSIDSSYSSSGLRTGRPGLQQTALLISTYNGSRSMSNLLLPVLWSNLSLLADGWVKSLTCGIKLLMRFLPSKIISLATNLLGLRHSGFELLCWLVLFYSFADVFLLMAAGVLRSLLLVAVVHTLSLVLLRLVDGSRLRWRTSLGGLRATPVDVRPFVVYVLYPSLAVVATAGLASMYESRELQ